MQIQKFSDWSKTSWVADLKHRKGSLMAKISIPHNSFTIATCFKLCRFSSKTHRRQVSKNCKNTTQPASSSTTNMNLSLHSLSSKAASWQSCFFPTVLPLKFWNFEGPALFNPRDETMVMPTPKPMMPSTKKAVSRVKPNDDKDLLSMLTDMNQTPSKAPIPQGHQMLIWWSCEGNAHDLHPPKTDVSPENRPNP